MVIKLKGISAWTLLEDGEWHRVEELTDKTSIPEEKVEKIGRALREMKLVELKENEDKIEKIKISSLGSKLLEL